MDAPTSRPVERASNASAADGPGPPVSPAAIAESLALDRSKRNIARWARLMARRGVDFDAFFDELQERKRPTRWQMTWLLSHYVERNRRDGARAEHRIWQSLTDCNDPGMRRELWRALSFIDVDEDLAGDVFDRAISVIRSPAEPIAVRAHAMFAARNVARPHAPLRRELRLVLEAALAEDSPAIRARSRNVLEELRKADLSRDRRARP